MHGRCMNVGCVLYHVLLYRFPAGLAGPDRDSYSYYEAQHCFHLHVCGQSSGNNNDGY